jgi:hypothetical protein
VSLGAPAKAAAMGTRRKAAIERLIINSDVVNPGKSPAG